MKNYNLYVILTSVGKYSVMLINKLRDHLLLLKVCNLVSSE